MQLLAYLIKIEKILSMLIQFSVANYRSIKENQILSMVAAQDSSLQKSNCIATGHPQLPYLLRTGVLYGANASGKSNLIAALTFVKNMVESSAVSIREGQTLNITPFCFDPKTINQPSEFEITLIEEGVRYQYGFAVNAHRVIREWLFAGVKSKTQLWFARKYNAKKDQDIWDFGSHFFGRKQRDLWSQFTRGNALFLSTAVNFNSAQLRPLFNWFVNKLLIIGAHGSPPPILYNQLPERSV